MNPDLFISRLLMPGLFLAACGSDPAEDDGKGSTESPRETSPYEMPDTSNCTYDIEFDADDDGSLDYVRHEILDEEERTVVIQYEHYVRPDRRDYEATYDELGCLSYVNDETDLDGLRTVTAYESTCDEAGNKLTVNQVQTYYDENGDLSHETVWYITYENTYEQGLLTRTIVSYTVDDDTEPYYIERRELAYTDGLLTSQRYFVEDEEWYDLSWTWLEEDKLLSYVYKNYYEGWTTTYGFTYDEHGRLIVEDESSGATGRTFRTQTTWDSDHYRVLRTESDEDQDGVVDTTWTYHCEGDFPWGCEVELDEAGEEAGDDSVADGTTDHRYWFHWTCP